MSSFFFLVALSVAWVGFSSEQSWQQKVCPRVKRTCLTGTEDLFAESNDAKKGKRRYVTSFQFCEKSCRMDKKCVGCLFLRKNKRCMHYTKITANATMSVQSNRQSGICTKQWAECKSVCGLERSGEILFEKKCLNNAKECEKQCSSHPICAGFNFVKGSCIGFSKVTSQKNSADSVSGTCRRCKVIPEGLLEKWKEGKKKSTLRTCSLRRCLCKCFNTEICKGITMKKGICRLYYKVKNEPFQNQKQIISNPKKQKSLMCY